MPDETLRDLSDFGRCEGGDAIPAGENPLPSCSCGTHELGRRGEDAAARNLVSRGWDILERNWRWDHGEVDIIAHEPSAPENCVALIEVKTRRCSRDGEEVIPELAIDERKQRRYVESARRYLQLHSRFEFVRFDAIAISARDGGRAHLRHIPHAFQAAW